eukprot:TRINITY_DN67781_c5_g4_i1.p1 TRINITY_DN67781_c5_g4~~TRINITY_DN67781_c5_g4_i1.p1  ORF type:complete len:953 (+),score=126.03 TRINITY_DN67781_c5_g4_i1:56-2914(+)
MSSVHSNRLRAQPPPNYVAGLGRGASGFTTRSDVGPGRFDESGPVITQAMKAEAAADDRKDYSETQFDSWSGYSESLFQGTVYEADDEEADRIYNTVDDAMDGRRKRQREEAEAKRTSEFRKQRPKIQQMFSDLKKRLGDIGTDEWTNIPDIGDTTVKKRKKQDIWTPVPDSVLSGGLSGGSHSTLSSKQHNWGGMATPEGATPVTDLRAFGDARSCLMSVKLQQISDSVQGQTVVDPQGYLTNLNHQHTNTDAEIGDLKRARLLLKSVTTTNPNHGPGWIAAARVEEIAGRVQAARAIIAEGCEACPTQQDVWLEAVRIATPANAKKILARAVQQIPHSVKLWSQAHKLETDVKKKKAVLRKALEIIPNSVRLWQEAVELETAEDAKILLSRAVECVNNVDLWLALAKLEVYKNAKAVLNRARQANPTEPLIWIAAAQLEEANQNFAAVETIVSRAVKTMAGNQVTREQWLTYAEGAEKADHLVTCKQIVTAAVGLDLDDSEKKHTWIADAEKCLANECVETARAIYAHALKEFSNKKGLWLRAAHLEKQHGTPQKLDDLLKEAVKYCPQAEILWLMAAKESWNLGDVSKSRNILGEAFKANPNSESIWLAAVKLESENKETERARLLLQKARGQAGTTRIWMKSAKLERQLGEYDNERKILDDAVEKFATTTTEKNNAEGLSVVAKLWLMLLQSERRRIAREQKQDKSKGATPQDIIANNKQRYDQIRHTYTRAYKSCGESLHVWLAAADIEEKVCKDMVKARAIIEKAKLRNGSQPLLWLHSIRMEHRSGNEKLAKMHLSKALQEFPSSGLIWAEAIEMEPAATKKAKSVQAIKRCDKDARVICAVAKLFWAERKFDKTRSWFGRAVALDSDLGDAWANLYRFEVQHGDEEKQQKVIASTLEAEPHHGELWCSVSKDPEYCTVGGCSLSPTEILKKVAQKVDMSTYAMQ